MLFVLYGTNRLAVRERRDALLREHLPVGAEEYALQRLDGQKCSADELARAVQTLSFFGDRRVVLIDDLLTRFEPRRRRGETADSAGGDNAPAGEAAHAENGAPTPAGRKAVPSRAFAAAFENIAPGTTVICWERGTVGKTNPLLKAAARLGSVEVFEAPKAGEVEDWIFARARQKGARLKPEVPRLLAEF